jgi:hypothetical protein
MVDPTMSVTIPVTLDVKANFANAAAANERQPGGGEKRRSTFRQRG